MNAEGKRILALFSPSARKALEVLAGNPKDAADWFNKIMDVQAALRIGCEIMERTGDPLEQGSVTLAIGAIRALDAFSQLVKALHPELGQQNLSNPATPAGLPGTNGASRVRPLDLDPASSVAHGHEHAFNAVGVGQAACWCGKTIDVEEKN